MTQLLSVAGFYRVKELSYGDYLHTHRQKISSIITANYSIEAFIQFF